MRSGRKEAFWIIGGLVVAIFAYVVFRHIEYSTDPSLEDWIDQLESKREEFFI